jgi:hypothetical protein
LYLKVILGIFAEIEGIFGASSGWGLGILAILGKRLKMTANSAKMPKMP